jgi:hypothetical protein
VLDGRVAGSSSAGYKSRKHTRCWVQALRGTQAMEDVMRRSTEGLRHIQGATRRHDHELQWAGVA